MQTNLSGGPKAQGIVAQVLDVIARDLPAPRAVILGRVDPDHIAELCLAAIAPDPAVLVQTAMRLRQEGVSAATLAEVYVPCVARRLGEDWVADELDFRAVSVGSSRLQSLLWKLAPEWAQSGVLVSTARAPVMVAVPAGCQHTLGATVLAGQLRYRGILAELDLAFTGAQSHAGAAQKQFTAIFISASAREPLEYLATLVQKACQTYPRTPVLIGGNVTDQMVDIQKYTNADLVTCDLEQALAFCGLGASFAPATQARQSGGAG